MQTKVWDIKKVKGQKLKVKIEDIVSHLLTHRGVTTARQREAFLNPRIESVFEEIAFPELGKAIKRIKQAIGAKEKIIVFSDYDADGICATAIMWEAIRKLGGDVMPYMPDRMTEGYGLSKGAIEKLAKDGVSLIITVDNGITCTEQVELATSLGVDVIITDHHQIPKNPPKPYATVWSDKICGAVVAWVVAQTLHDKKDLMKWLELAALATVADVMPLAAYNRAIVVEGLKILNKTDRVGLEALFHEAGLLEGTIDAWSIGHVIAPRLNAMGRLESAMDSLRLLVTNNPLKAKSYALMLAKTNSERQKLTEKMVEDAKLLYKEEMIVGVLSHEAWHEGVVGLVAGRMTEAYYRPMIAIARGTEFSKGSARSIPGFNIVEALRSLNGMFENIGGHPMAAGFTIRTEKIGLLVEQLDKYAQKNLTNDTLQRKLAIDMQLDLEDVTFDLYKAIQHLAPFGFGNPEPVFVTKNLQVEEVKKVGATGRHIKLLVSQQNDGDKEITADVDQAYIMPVFTEKPYLEAIGFGMGEMLAKLRPGSVVDIAYTLALNSWNGRQKLELKIKDIRSA